MDSAIAQQLNKLRPIYTALTEANLGDRVTFVAEENC
jgi:hypothetical protein